jgi:hypothetical protein
MDKKQIVFVNQSAGYLMVDIINAFEEQFDERILLTGFLNERNNKLSHNIKVEKLIRYNRSSSFKRIFTWSFAFLKALWLIKIKYRKAHLFLVSNPPFATLLPLFCNNSFDILIYDIFPDALVEFKIISSNSIIAKWWSNANQNIFVKARKVFTISEPMKDRLSRYVVAEKIEVVPIWTDNNFLKPIPKNENLFLKNINLQDRFLIVYSGNMGKSHPVVKMIELAERFQTTNEVHFLLIGGGHQYLTLEDQIHNSGLKNINIMPWQPTENLPYTLSAPHLALVTIGNEASDLSIPSKLFNFMSTGTPILCIAPKSSALSRLVLKEEIGNAFTETELDEMVDFINKSKEDSIYYNSLMTNSIATSLKYSPKNALKFI